MNEIKGIGTDIVEIARLKKAVDRQGEDFLLKLFSKEEIAYCKKFKDPFPRFAGKYAAKEAFSKAIGKGFGKELGILDVEIKNERSGKPYIETEKDFGKIFLSISHERSYAIAFVIIT